ncbi:MAG: O-antigen ligase family protein [Solirubrobacterales bacterium]
MLRTDMARIDTVERPGLPWSPVLMGLLGSAAAGYLLTVNILVGFSFLAFLALFSVIVLRPVSLIPGLIVLTVFVEKALQAVGISVGGRELVNLCGLINFCLAAAIVFYAMTSRMRPFQSLVTPSFSLYLLVVFLSLFVSADVQMTVRSIVRITAGYCIYLMITQFVTERRQVDRLVQLLLLVSVIPITVGLYQIVFENHFVMSRDMRIKGTFKNGMSYAMYMACLLPYIFGQVVFNKTGRIRRSVFAALFAAGVMNLVYTGTRIGWGAFALAMTIYALLTDARRLLPILLIVLVLAVGLFFPFFVKSFGGYFTTDWSTYFSNNVGWDFRSADYMTASSLHIRVYVWRNMVHALMAANPWIGAGSGTWFENLDVKTMGFPLASHSDYFEVLFGTGFIGLTFYLLFRMRQLTLLARFAASGVERSLKTAVLFPCLATHIACLAMSVTEVWQAYNGLYWLSWITIGICEAYYREYCASEPCFEIVDGVPVMDTSN